MSTFTCHCGGTVTGTSVNGPADPTWTFNCDNHQGGGARDLLIVEIAGTPTDPDEETRMGLMKDAIDANEQWFIDNPAPGADLITSKLIL